MKNFCKILFLFIILSVNTKAQTVTWQKWYDYNNFENAGESVEQTFDGGYIVLGNTYETLNYFSVLIKTDNLGNIQWQKVLDYSVTNNDFLSCFAIHQTNDSGYTVSGFGRDSAVLIKTNKNGDVVWLKKYTKPGYEDASFFNHKNTVDGGIIACGNLISFDKIKNYILKTDSLGNKEWDFSIDNIANESINNIIESKAGSFYFTGLNRIVKINSSGNHIWSHEILKIGSDLIEISTYTLLLAGSNPKMYLTKIDTSGKVIWQKSYFPGAACLSMTLSKDNNVLLSGFKETPPTYYTAVTKADTSGNEIFTKSIISASSNYYFISWAVSSTKDSGFIITGRTDFPGIPFRDNIYVIKTDSLCNAPELVGININNESVPNNFELYQNYPNPFNPETTIKYELSKSGFVNLKIFDLNGKEICSIINKFQQPGNYEIQFNSLQYNLSSGIFFCKMNVGYKSNIIKLVIIK